MSRPLKKTMHPPEGESSVKAGKRRKMYVIFFFFFLKAPLEHPRVPSAWPPPPARCIVGGCSLPLEPALQRPGLAGEEGIGVACPVG